MQNFSLAKMRVYSLLSPIHKHTHISTSITALAILEIHQIL